MLLTQMRKFAVLAMILLTSADCFFFDWKFTLSLRQFEKIRDTMLNAVGRTTSSSFHLQRAARLGKLQPAISEDVPFPCPTLGLRSPVRPTSVHRLRPGDIDVIGALGDSLTAGNGAAASNVLQVITENRGISWSIGGQGTWRSYLTLPNILKEYNPQLIGFSLSDSFSNHRASQFNVGEIGAMSNDLPYMAGQLIKRIRSDPRVVLDRDWKLITLMMGSNDFCIDLCYVDSRKAPERHRQNLIKALDLLQRNLPRTLVQVVISPNLGNILTQFRGTKPICRLTHSAECPCLFGLAYKSRQIELLNIMEQWQQVEFQVANDLRYQIKEDFTVIAQTFTSNLTFPTQKTRDGRVLTDFTYLSEDCFHFSQKGYSRAANALWNNMFEPVGRKTPNWEKEFTSFMCPSEDRPFICTSGNS